MANSTSYNLLGWNSSPGGIFKILQCRFLFVLLVFLYRTTRSWGNYIGDHWRTVLASHLPIATRYTRCSQGQCSEVSGTSRHPHRFIGLLLLLFCGFSNSQHAGIHELMLRHSHTLTIVFQLSEVNKKTVSNIEPCSYFAVVNALGNHPHGLTAYAPAFLTFTPWPVSKLRTASQTF